MTHVILKTKKEENELMVVLGSLAREKSYLDIMYVKYLNEKTSTKRGVVAKSFTEFLILFYKSMNSTNNPKKEVGKKENILDINDDHETVKSCKFISLVDTYQHAIIYSQIFKTNFNSVHFSLQQLHENKSCSLVCHVDTESNQHFFGFPLFFFRANYTSAIQNIPMAKIKWIPFQFIKSYRSSTVGRITKTTWTAVTDDFSTTNISLNGVSSFISCQQLEPSRYCISFIPPKNGDVYVTMAFIALDADNIGDGIQSDSFIHDFGDNQLGAYLNTTHKHNSLIDHESEEEDNDYNISEDYDTLRKHLPLSVLNFLTS